MAASKDLVCARLLTYESAEEAKVLTALYVGRSGRLENTTFVVLAPDGVTPLTRAGRSPGHILHRPGEPPPPPGGDEAGALATLLATQAKRYPAKPSAASESPLLPYLADVRRGLGVAACDMLPLAIVIGPDAEAREALEKHLRPLAWAEARAGRMLYAPAASIDDLKAIADVEPRARLVVVQPDAYGLKGQVLAHSVETTPEALAKALDEGLAQHKATKKEARPHIAEGQRQGVEWKTEIPVTDPGATRGR